MTDDDFQAFVDDCFERLEQKQSDLQTVYGIGPYPRWHLDQTTEKLRFFDSSDQLAVQAHVINIGSFASNSNTWKWAWANDSVPSGLRLKAEPLKELSAITGLDFFRQSSPSQSRMKKWRGR